MVATELTRTPRAYERRLPNTWLKAYVALWATTLAATGATALCTAAPAQRMLGLHLHGRLAPAPSLMHALTLLAHNLPIAAWPLLLSRLDAREHVLMRAMADATVALCALANTLPVGLALAGYGAALLPYVPQLPFEWAALAVGYGAWMIERDRPLLSRERILTLTLIGWLMGIAAMLETVAVPHR